MVRKHFYFSGRVQGVGFRYQSAYYALLWNGMVLNGNRKEPMRSICLFWILKSRRGQKK